MKIAAYQFNVSGNIAVNLHKIVNALHIAVNSGAKLFITPECALTGYPPHDIADSHSVNFDAVQSAICMLQNEVDTTQTTLIVGTIDKIENKICNCAHILQPNKPPQTSVKRALWGWDIDNFDISECNDNGIFELEGQKIGVRICFEVRFPEYFRELYRANANLGVVLFYDKSETNDLERYNLIKGHLQTRAAENVLHVISVNTSGNFQTAPTALFDGSGNIVSELAREQEDLLLYDLNKKQLTFSEQGRKFISGILNDKLC